MFYLLIETNSVETTRLALMMADLLLFHFLSRYDTGYADLQKVLEVHDAIVSIKPEP